MAFIWVTREEGGFFTQLGARLSDAGVASLRFDLRGHGESEGCQEELTLATILNDIRVALAHLREKTGVRRLSLLGASFAGGLCAYYAAKRQGELDRLILLNPQLDYKWRTIDSRPYWSGDYLDDETARQLDQQGFIQFTPTLKHGRPLLNEVFWFEVGIAPGQRAAGNHVSEQRCGFGGLARFGVAGRLSGQQRVSGEVRPR